MEYKVIYFQSAFSAAKAFEKLVKAVNEAIALGWEPAGGVSATDYSVAQAMIKRR
jgi:hypothetical protein